jgi:hypothetical protein
MGQKTSKVGPVFEPIPEGPYQTRMFALQFDKKSHENPMKFRVMPRDASRTSLYFVVKYNRGDLSATEQVMVNGNLVHIPASAGNALRWIYQNPQPILGCTSGWTPAFWIDVLCVNERDEHEWAMQRQRMEYIFAAAKFTLDFTGPSPRIVAGGAAYVAPTVNILGTPEVNMHNLVTNLENIDRLREHQPGRTLYSA